MKGSNLMWTKGLTDSTSLQGEIQSELVSNSTTPANFLPGDEVDKEHTKTLLDARVKPHGIRKELC